MATQTAFCVAAIPHSAFVLPPTGIVRTSLLVTGSISQTESPASQTAPAPTARKLGWIQAEIGDPPDYSMGLGIDFDQLLPWS